MFDFILFIYNVFFRMVYFLYLFIFFIYFPRLPPSFYLDERRRNKTRGDERRREERTLREGL